MSAVIAQAARFAWLDARGKRAARELGLSLMQAKRLMLGQVSESEERRVLLALRDKLKTQREQLEAVQARLEEALNADSPPEHLGGLGAVVVETDRLAARRGPVDGAQGREGADR